MMKPKQVRLFAAMAKVVVARVGGPHRTMEAEIGCRVDAWLSMTVGGGGGQMEAG